MCGGGDITKNIETSTETTYHEFTQNFSSGGSADANVDYTSSNYNYGDKIEYEEKITNEQIRKMSLRNYFVVKKFFAS